MRFEYFEVCDKCGESYPQDSGLRMTCKMERNAPRYGPSFYRDGVNDVDVVEKTKWHLCSKCSMAFGTWVGKLPGGGA